MQLPELHRYATRPGLFFTDDGGADIVARSETAEQLWFCVLEPLEKPSMFYNEAVRINEDDDHTFVENMKRYAVCTRIVKSLRVRETLFRMEGPHYGLWYLHLPKAWSGMHYGYRADGAWEPQRGLRFNPYQFLLDPYAKGVEGSMQLLPDAFDYECTLEDGHISGSSRGPASTIDSLGAVPISVAIDDRDKTKHDADPSHPHVPWSKTVIYELHVKGFTANAPWLPEEKRGTYAGLADPVTLSYLQGLGVTSIELLPIMAKQPEVFLQEKGMPNYWGYSTLNFFSPEPSYATKEAQRKGAAAVRQEVLDMIRALHEAGFEVIMDVVFNHTCEGGNDGPSVCWRGLDNLTFYRQQEQNIGALEDTTGCGNTVDFTNTHNITFAIDSLRYWARRIGVDGFRFDLGVSLARLNGSFTPYHPFLYALRSDQLLGNLKLIMEPWDVGNQGWRTGQFLSPFAEWNDRFRDTARRFWISNVNTFDRERVGMQELATRLCGSADLFATDPGRGATSSVNFITAHDGFTLQDLTQYEYKHNEANGEHNRDGSSHNNSANFGVEGPTDDHEINTLRDRTCMNMLGTTLLALGTPMILAGDEFGNSQQGNNNAYCQDNPMTWLNWDWLVAHKKTPQFRRMESVARLIAVRKSLDIYNHEDFYTRLSALGLFKPSNRVQWILPDGKAPADRDWFDNTIRSFTMHLRSQDELDILIVVNGSHEAQHFRLPEGEHWHVLWSSAENQGIRPQPGEYVEQAEVTDELTIWPQTTPFRRYDLHEPMFPTTIAHAAEEQVAHTYGSTRTGELAQQLVQDIRETIQADIEQRGISSELATETSDTATAEIAHALQRLVQEKAFERKLLTMGPAHTEELLPKFTTMLTTPVAASALPSTSLRLAKPHASDHTQYDFTADDPDLWTFPELSISILLEDANA